MARLTARIAFIGLLIIAAPEISIADIPDTERNALIALYGTTNGSSWHHSTGWLGIAGSECSWYGVTCDGTGSTVTQINLATNNLNGSVPSIVEQLPSLQILNLSGNNLSGTVPSSLGSLSVLQELLLGYDGSLTGSIPTELGNLTQLTHLTLNGHELSGSIPVSLFALGNLEDLYLGNNQLTGSIPSAISGLTSIKNLELYNNPIGGVIPTELWSLTTLEDLHLGNCGLSGTIPSAISNLSNLLYLKLGDNSLSGEIPAEITSLSELRFLYFSNNSLSGPLPPGLDAMTSLRTIYADGNHLNGSIPGELGNLPEIFTIDLSHNRLTGPIPADLANATTLSFLYLSDNRLTGPLPEVMGLMTGLTRLRIDRNAIVGEIPSMWASLTTLVDDRSDLRYNGLFTPSSSFSAWLDQKQAGAESWTESQTPPPSDFTISGQNGVAIWGGLQHLGLVDAAGGHEVKVSEVGGGSTRIGSWGGLKISNSWEVHGLEPGIPYAFRARSWTWPHTENANMIVGEWTDPILATLHPESSTLYVATDGIIANDCRSPEAPCPTISNALALAIGHERIVVAPGTYPEILTIPFSVDIIGAGHDEVIVDGGAAGSVATVYSGSTFVRLHGMTLTNGSNYAGAGIQVEGGAVLNVNECLVSNNVATYGGGIRLFNGASAILEHTSISDNEAYEHGGGIDSLGLLWIENSEITGNTAAHFGGINVSTPTHRGGMFLDRSTVSGNSCPTDSGGGIRADAEYLGIFDSAITENTALMGGGVAALADTWQIKNSTVSGNVVLEPHAPTGLWISGTFGELEACTITENSGTGNATAITTDSTTIAGNNIIAGNSPLNCDGSITSIGFNLEDADSCGFDLESDLVDTSPTLQPLADNGGPTWTHAIGPGSAALESGDPWTTMTTDQRGHPRPFDGNADGTATSDIGAFEYSVGWVFSDGFESGDTVLWATSTP